MTTAPIDYDAAIAAELDRLHALNTRRAQREATIRAIASARVRGESESATLGQTFGGVRTIAPRRYYHKAADWYHNPLFRDVLENVADLYARRDREEAEAAAAAARKQRHEERAALIRRAKVQLAKLLDGMELEDATPSQVARFMAEVMRQEREEFDELPTTRRDITSGGEPLAVPITVIDFGLDDDRRDDE